MKPRRARQNQELAYNARRVEFGALGGGLPPPTHAFARLARRAALLLPGRRADFNRLMHAVRMGESGRVRELPPTPAAWGRAPGASLTPLAWAARAGNAELVGLLLPASDPSEGSRSQRSNALMEAAGSGEARCVEALLPHCDPLLKDKRGKTALIMAAASGNKGGVLALLPVSDPGARDESGKTALAWAARAGHLECVLALIPSSDPNSRDQNGWTALMEASGGGHLECVQALIPVSDLSARSLRGESAQEAARGESREEIDVMIEGWGMAVKEAQEIERAAPAGALPQKPRSARL